MNLCSKTLVSLATVLACIGSAQAEVFSSTVSFNGLTLRLEDLAPDDGIAPAAVFFGTPIASTGWVNQSVFGAPAATTITLDANQLFSASSASLVSPMASDVSGISGVWGDRAISVRTELPSDLATLRSEAGGYTNSQQIDRLTGVAINPSTGLMTRFEEYTLISTNVLSRANAQTLNYDLLTDSFSDWGLEVTPNTAVYLEGSVDIAVTFDPALLQQLLSQADLSEAGYNEATAFINAQAVVPGTTDGMFREYGVQIELGPDGIRNVFENAAIPGALTESGYSSRESFSHFLGATGDEVSGMSFELGAISTSAIDISGGGAMTGERVRVWGDVVPTAPLIPEPSTWALMGLGLAGVGWAARRQQQIV